MSIDSNAFDVLTFDCYGTLIDWEIGIWDALQPLIVANQTNRITRATGLAAFALEESAQQAQTPTMRYPSLLTRVHARLASRLGLRTTDELDRDFGGSVPHWPAFPDTADALRQLKRRFKLVILSNVDGAGIAASQKKLGVEFDAVYTAEAIGSYKPAARNFDYLLEHLQDEHGILSHRILHTAQSLFHDHVPARRIGLACAWIDRQGLSESDNWGATAQVDDRPTVDFVFHTLGEMASAIV